MSLRAERCLRVPAVFILRSLLVVFLLLGILLYWGPVSSLAQDARKAPQFWPPGVAPPGGRALNVPYPSTQDLIRERIEEEKKKTIREELQETRVTTSACDSDEPSTIEKAYRIQYSDVILQQLKELEHLEGYPAVGEKTRPGHENNVIEPDIGRGRRLYDRGLLNTRSLDAEKQRLLYERRRLLQDRRRLLQDRRRLLTDRPSLFPPEPGDKDRSRRTIYPKREEALDALHWVVERYFTQFGYDLFIPEAFQPPTKVVPPDDYILGTGDVLRVNLWGSRADVQFEGEIRPDGTITLPKLGVIPIAGVPYGKINRVISREAKKYIKGVNLSVTLVRPRSLEVYVLGRVCMPGLRVVPAFSTVLTALAKAGGPLKTGSLRKIVIYRKGKLLRELDLYDLILKGDITNDVLLMDKDVIHVPYLGPTVAVVGAVLSPAIFEINKSPLEVAQALKLAGGTLSQAQVKLNIRRFHENRALTVLDVDLYDAALSGASVLDGDLVEVRYIGRRFPPTVKVTGHVWDTQEFEFHEGMRLSAVIPKPELLKPEAITDFFLLHRYSPETTELFVKRAPLAAVWQGEYDVELQPHDEIRILSKADYGITMKVYLRGGVWKPGDYDYTPDLTLTDLIAQGGGVKPGTNLTSVELSRQKIVRNEVVTEHKILDLTKPEVNLPLMAFDTVRVPMVKDAGVVRQVAIEGEVKFPGYYTLKKGERLSDLILRAGGFISTAYFYGVQYFSERAQEIQQKSIDRMIQDLELRLTGSTIQAAETAVEEEEVKVAEVTRKAQEAFMARLRAIKAKGRVSIELTDLKTFKGSSYDFELEEGDRLVIPNKPSFVSVIGSVYSPSSYLYQPNLRVKDYLKMAGGPTKTADESYIYIFKANGEVLSKDQSGTFLIPTFYSMNLMPGDTIVVPEDLERVPYLRLVKNITDIIFKIATTAGITVAILDRTD